MLLHSPAGSGENADWDNSGQFEWVQAQGCHSRAQMQQRLAELLAPVCVSIAISRCAVSWISCQRLLYMPILLELKMKTYKRSS